ncbi:hypothetical protein FJY93_02115 [Candidatus Kaiserbacteria bacterium]|nr:hypothetical protein [Candidatus Kaiserbacteria bacterium]
MSSKSDIQETVVATIRRFLLYVVRGVRVPAGESFFDDKISHLTALLPTHPKKQKNPFAGTDVSGVLKASWDEGLAEIQEMMALLFDIFEPESTVCPRYLLL